MLGSVDNLEEKQNLMSLSGIVVVTGGAGFIGSHIAQTVATAGAKVRIIDDLSTGHRENVDDLSGDIDLIEGSVADVQLMNRVLADAEVVFHEAAIPSVPRSVENPTQTHIASVDGTFTLLLAAREQNVRRVIYAASSSAYGDQPTLPKTEDMAPDPLSPYAVAKLVGEYYCQVFTRVYGLETVSLRYFNVFGPRQDPGSQYSGVVSRFISALCSSEQPVIFGDGEQSRDFTYIDNVVNANLNAATTTKGVGKVINVATGDRITLNQLLTELKDLLGKADVKVDFREPRIGDVRHSLADITRARELLDYEPAVGLREGLERTVKWWKMSRYAKV
ncbi:MAG TPA: SDR family oxidoreductase [Pyrinomonadaceae bacterium]|nr:SDR family oxidoreductase [Pyrinomonadaceae bacterium]